MNPRMIHRKKSGRSRRAAVLFLVTGSLIGMALVSTDPSIASKGSLASNDPLRPPGNVYTCPWIAEHPVEAAQARVTCDPGFFTPTPFPSPAFTYDSMTPQASGCSYQPPSGWIGQGVFTWTSFKYTNWWQWYEELPLNPNDPTHDYTWYVQRQNGTTHSYDRVFDGATHGTGVIGANNYRWGAQNHVDSIRRYFVCWDVR